MLKELIMDFPNKPWTLKQMLQTTDTDVTIKQKHGSGWNLKSDG